MPRAKTGSLVMDGRMDLGRSLEVGPELTGSRVKTTSLRGRDRAIERVAQELVPEVVEAANAGRIEDEVVDELLERRIEGGGRDVHDPGEDLRHEAPPDDRAGAGSRLGLGRELRDPGDDRILDRVGDGGFADRRPIGSRLGAQRAEKFLDVQRDAVRPLEHRGRDLARRWEPGIEDQGRYQGGLRLGQRDEPEFLRDPLRDEA